jgi:hypothetical protein
VTQPTENELAELNDRIDGWIAAGEAVNDEWAALWQDGIDYVFGNQLARTKRRKGWERVQDNHIFPALTQQIAMLMQRQPSIEPCPYEDADRPFMSFWKGLLQWQFENDLAMPLLASLAVLDAGIYGYYVAHVYGEPKAEWIDREKRWRWAPRTILLRPEYFGADPDAETLRDAAYVYCRRRMLLEKAVARWPEMKAAIEKAAREEGEGVRPAKRRYGFTEDYSLDDEESMDESGRKSVEGRLAQILLRRARGDDWGPGRAAGKTDDGLPRFVTVTQMYFRDGEEVAGQETQPVPAANLMAAGSIVQHPELGTFHVANPAAFPPGLAVGDEVPPDAWPTEIVRQWTDEPLFPHGRFVLRVGKTILNPDPDAQRYAFRRWPFVVGVNQALPHTWQGLNGVEMARGLQDWVNVSVAHLANYVKFFGDPVVMAEAGAIDADPDNKKITGKIRACAGAVWKLAKGGLGKIKREPPVPMPAGTMQIWEAMKQELKDQTGMQDVGMGRQTKGDPTAYEVSQLARNTQARTSMAAVYQDAWMGQVMTLVAEMDQKFLAPGDSVRITGEAQRGAAVAIAEGACDARFDVVMKIGVGLPFDRERTRKEAKELFEIIGAPYLPELLEAYSVANKDSVLARVQAWQEFQAYLAARAQQDVADAQAAEAERARLGAEGGASGGEPTEAEVLAGAGAAGE